jgi:tyrosine-protein kinase Etk/Wzc
VTLMRAPRSIIGTFAAMSAGARRLIFIGLAVVLAVLTFFPERYRSAATLAPSDPSTYGLGGSLNQVGAANSVFGNQAAVEITIRVARSVYVADTVLDRLHLLDRLHFSSRVAAHRWLADKIDVRSLRGGMVQMDTKQSSAQFAEELITTYAQATRERLGAINRQQTSYKRNILEKLVAESGERYDRAQLAYDNFRRQTRFSEPNYAISAIGGRIPVLQAAIKAKEVQLAAARQFATEENVTIRQIKAEMAALEVQLQQQRALDPQEENSVGRVVRQSTEVEKLERERNLARGLYEVYNRYLLGTSVEDLTSMASLRTIEPPFVDTSRQLNITFLALFILVVLFGVAVEFYQLRPPLEARVA